MTRQPGSSLKPAAATRSTLPSVRSAEVRTPTGGRWSVLITVALTCFVGQSFARFSFGLLLPAMKSDLRVTYGLAGWLGTINLAGYLLGTILTSIASTRFPAHRIMQIGVALATTGMFVLATVNTVPLLLVGMALGGVGGAASWIPAPIMAASVFPPERRALAMGATTAAIGLGIVVATALTRSTRSFTGNPGAWRPIWATEAAIGLIATVLAILVLRPIPLAGGAPPQLRVLRQVPRWWAPTIGYTFLGLAYVLFTTFAVSALEADAGFSKSHASNVYALIGAGNALGALSVGRIADRVGQRFTFAVSCLMAGAGCIAVLVGREPFVSVAGFGFGFGMAGGIVSITSYLGRTLAPQDFAAAFGVVTACFGVAQTIGPRLGGWIVDSTDSFRDVFLVAGSAWFICALMALGLPRRHHLAALAPPSGPSATTH